MKNIRLVIADVDGTMVNDHRQLSAFTKKIIEELHEHGILFGVSSGRDYVQLLADNHYWGFIHPFDLTVGMNGGQIWLSKEKKLYEYNKLEPETVKEIIMMMEPLDLNPFVYGPNHTMICKKIDEATQASGERNDMKLHVVKDLSEFWQHAIPKIMYRTKADEMDNVYRWASEHLSKKYQAFKTQTTMLEFQDPAINKGVGLQNACDLLGISAEEVMAFGDMSNDNPMLEAAGIGVAMANGAEDTKQCADFITESSNNEDGFAKFLQSYLKL